jgi:cellobiose phosphorylase
MVIDSLPQSWSVICGLGNLDRSKVAMHSVVQRLVRDDVGVLLFTPPFDKTDHDPGYVKAYIPGLRENGGQYTHGSLWTAQAYARLGDGDTAVRLLRLMGPRSHSETQEQAEKYKVEPYVAVGDIYSAVGQEGRGGWTWYTGAASWMYRIWVNDVLGLKKRGTRFTIDPAIPKDWPSYQITVKYKSAVYKIIVENPDGVGAGTRSFELDSCKVDGEWINMVGDGKTHNVRVVLSAGPRTQVFGDAGFENPPIAEHVQAARD